MQLLIATMFFLGAALAAVAPGTAPSPVSINQGAKLRYVATPEDIRDVEGLCQIKLVGVAERRIKIDSTLNQACGTDYYCTLFDDYAFPIYHEGGKMKYNSKQACRDDYELLPFIPEPVESDLARKEECKTKIGTEQPIDETFDKTCGTKRYCNLFSVFDEPEAYAYEFKAYSDSDECLKSHAPAPLAG